MMGDFKVMQDCNHVIYATNHFVADIDVVRTGDSSINDTLKVYDRLVYTDNNDYPDNVSISYSISKIFKVYTTDATGKHGVYTGDYIFYPGSQYLVWLNNIPPLGSPYTVSAFIAANSVAVYTSDTCPRCSGYGWYIDIVNNAAGNLLYVQGAYKVAQDVTAMVSTRVGDAISDINYGSYIPDIIAKWNFNEPGLNQMLTNQIGLVEARYKSYQSKALNTPESELLNRLILKDYNLDQDTLTVTLTVGVYLIDGTSATTIIPVQGRVVSL